MSCSAAVASEMLGYHGNLRCCSRLLLCSAGPCFLLQLLEMLLLQLVSWWIMMDLLIMTHLYGLHGFDIGFIYYGTMVNGCLIQCQKCTWPHCRGLCLSIRCYLIMWKWHFTHTQLASGWSVMEVFWMYISSCATCAPRLIAVVYACLLCFI